MLLANVLTPDQLAARCECTAATVKRLVRCGLLKPHRVIWRVPVWDANALVIGYAEAARVSGMPVLLVPGGLPIGRTRLWQLEELQRDTR